MKKKYQALNVEDFSSKLEPFLGEGDLPPYYGKKRETGKFFDNTCCDWHEQKKANK